MVKCRGQLVQQRRLLQDEARQLEAEHETMQELSEQMNRAVAVKGDSPVRR